MSGLCSLEHAGISSCYQKAAQTPHIATLLAGYCLWVISTRQFDCSCCPSLSVVSIGSQEYISHGREQRLSNEEVGIEVNISVSP
jgi:hypothetical protein